MKCYCPSCASESVEFEINPMGCCDRCGYDEDEESDVKLFGLPIPVDTHPLIC